MDNKKIGIASDHAGYQLKEFVIGYLDSKGYDVYDFGTNSEESCDYPDYAHPLAEAIEKGELPRGIAMCGSANGITMTLNKHQGIRAALCWEPEIASLARRDPPACVPDIDPVMPATRVSWLISVPVRREATLPLRSTVTSLVMAVTSSSRCDT